MNDAFLIKGDICYSKNEDTLHEFKNAYLYCQNCKSEGVLLNIPSDLQNIPVYDYSGCIVIPGFIDLHTHASQYKYRGIGTDLLFSDWMNKFTKYFYNENGLLVKTISYEDSTIYRNRYE